MGQGMFWLWGGEEVISGKKEQEKESEKEETGGRKVGEDEMTHLFPLGWGSEGRVKGSEVRSRSGKVSRPSWVCVCVCANVLAKDLRGGAALILAGLSAEGKTVVSNSHYVERGYENIEQTLKSLGANISLVI